MTDFETFELVRKSHGSVVPVSEEFADYCLEVVPPYYARGFFGVGEPYSHKEGEPVTTWIMCRRGQYYATHGTRREAHTAFVTFLAA